MVVLLILLSSACLLAVMFYLQLMWKYRRVREALLKLPGPTPLPIVGNVLHFTGNAASCNNKITKLAIQFKGLFRLWLGPIPVVVVSNPTDLKIILNTSNMLSKDLSYQFAEPYLGQGLLTAPVSLWKKYRRLLNPVMHPSNVMLSIPEFNAVSRKFISDLERNNGIGPIDPKHIIYSNIVDAASETIFGRAGLSEKFKTHLFFLVDWSGTASVTRFINPLYYIYFVFNILNGKKEKQSRCCISGITSEFNQVLETFQKRSALEIKKNSRDGTSILDVMYGTETLYDSHWMDEVITFLIGATDTMVSAIYFLLASLAIHQEVQDKVYSEIKEVLGSCEGDLTLKDLNSLTYLGHAITESMRLHGVFPIIGRMATKDTKLIYSEIKEVLSSCEGDLTLKDLNSLTYLGHAFTESMRLHGVFPIIGRVATKDTKLSQCTLPAGTRVLISLHAMGMDPEVFSEPLRYNPDRYTIEENKDKISHMSHILTFSAGPRNCIGKVYALHLIKIITARVISKYKLVTEMKMEDIEYEYKVIMFSKNPIMIDFQPRQT